MEKSKERLEVLNRINEFEKEKKFDIDVENDLPAKPLEANEVDYLNKIYLNKLCYDYLTLDDESKNPIINDMIYHLAKITNKKHIPILIGVGIPEKIAWNHNFILC